MQRLRRRLQLRRRKQMLMKKPKQNWTPRPKQNWTPRPKQKQMLIGFRFWRSRITKERNCFILTKMLVVLAWGARPIVSLLVLLCSGTLAMANLHREGSCYSHACGTSFFRCTQYQPFWARVYQQTNSAFIARIGLSVSFYLKSICVLWVHFSVLWFHSACYASIKRVRMNVFSCALTVFKCALILLVAYLSQNESCSKRKGPNTGDIVKVQGRPLLHLSFYVCIMYTGGQCCAWRGRRLLAACSRSLYVLFK